MRDRTVKLQCPTCDRRLKVPNPKPNKPIVCPKCNARFRLDANSRIVVVSGQNELFGPPVNAVLYDDNRLKPASNVRAAFEDIDHLFTSGDHLKSDVHNRRPDLPPIDVNADPDAARITASNVESSADEREIRIPHASVQESWAAQKRVLSKSDEWFQRNGTGLLILAFGLAMLPFVGRQVDGLASVLPWLPWAAILMAFIGCFMMAFALRRGKLSAVMWCALPLLLVGMFSLGGHFLNKWYPPGNGTDGLFADLAEEKNDVPGNPDRPNEKGDDPLMFNADDLADNAAARFVPPRKDKPLAADKRPAIDARKRPQPSTEADDVEPEPAADLNAAQRSGLPRSRDRDDPSHVATSPFRPAEALQPPVATARSGDSTIESEMKLAERISANSVKRTQLLKRTMAMLTKGLVDRDTIRSPIELLHGHVLSPTAGQQSVYGFATFHDEPIAGFDAALVPDGADHRIDLIVPIIGPAEFPDSIALPNGAKLTGLKLNIQADAIVGIQGQFLNPDGANNGTVDSQWLGLPTTHDHAAVIQAAGRPVHGIVLYRNQLELVGVALILGQARDAAE